MSDNTPSNDSSNYDLKKYIGRFVILDYESCGFYQGEPHEIVSYYQNGDIYFILDNGEEISYREIHSQRIL